MICIGVIPCLSSGMAKNDKIMSMLVLFPNVFGHFESLTFFENRGTNLTIKHDILVNF